MTGVDEPKIPPQKTMIECFRTGGQGYTDLKVMIEETRKRENSDFGAEIVNVAQAVRDKRE